LQKANQPVPSTEFEDAIELYDYYPDVDMEYYKLVNWGKLDGKVVCLDYGLDDAYSINKQRAYYESKRNTRIANDSSTPGNS